MLVMDSHRSEEFKKNHTLKIRMVSTATIGFLLFGGSFRYPLGVKVIIEAVGRKRGS